MKTIIPQFFMDLKMFATKKEGILLLDKITVKYEWQKQLTKTQIKRTKGSLGRKE